MVTAPVFWRRAENTSGLRRGKRCLHGDLLTDVARPLMDECPGGTLREYYNLYLKGEPYAASFKIRYPCDKT